LTRFLVDTNVIIDILSRDPRWYEWSAEVLLASANLGPLAINPIIFAELSVGFERIEDLDRALPEADWQRLPLPWSAGFLAGRCFVDYRRRGGSRARPLPDFYIGAHAAVDDLALITRDVSRFRTYFPTVELIAPEGDLGPPGAGEAP
jgi:predicted nucleic acid-binding protein